MFRMEAITGILTAVPLDWFILGGVLVAVALDSLRSGVGRALSISVALVLALAFFSLVEQTVFLGSSGFLESSIAQTGLFAALVLALFFIVRRMGLDFASGGIGEPVQALLAGAATMVVLIVIWLQVPELNSLWQFKNQVQIIFGEQFRLFWLFGSFAALAFARG